MKLVLILVSLLLGFLESESAGISKTQKAMEPTKSSPYCQPTLCQKGQEHVACKKKKTAKSRKNTCLEMHLVDFSEFKDRILQLHNEHRYGLANSKDLHLPDAARMVAMQWSPELATVAGFNARMCHVKHDKCRNTAAFPRSGQNIFVTNLKRRVSGKALVKLYAELLGNATRTWWLESANMTAADMKLYPCEFKKQKAFRHFAVMAVEGNSHVGCAGAHYVVRNMTQFKLTCNYARSPVCGQPIYQFQGCKTGRNQRHKALCSPSELFR